ncbi:MAG: NADH-quinone oxidoreductase subunit A [Deltaproteobacteria bacterium]|jgi:NADH-quinone oxidoreductase subunit A|nr:NADH-quinone oxidoreductase subunit A [Deltaproteobacteria bacterium]
MNPELNDTPYLALLITTLVCLGIVVFMATFKNLLLPLCLYFFNLVFAKTTRHPLSFFFKSSKTNSVKQTAFECGTLGTNQTGQRLNIKFYLVAVVFALFDVELALIYPYAVNVEVLGQQGFVAIFLFVSLVEISLLYIWKRGVLDWLK